MQAAMKPLAEARLQVQPTVKLQLQAQATSAA